MQLISSMTARLRYPIGQPAKSIGRLQRFLPAGLYEGGRRTFSLGKTRRTQRVHQNPVALVTPTDPIPGSKSIWTRRER